MIRWSRALAPCALLAVSLNSASAQQVGAAVAPDTVTVGDVFAAAVRVVVPPGHRVAFPDSIPVSGIVEAAGRRRVRVDTLADALRFTATYPLSAWRPGAQGLPGLAVRVLGPGGAARTLDVRFPGFFVASVLPADTAGLQPRPPKDVVGGVGFPWLRLLAFLLLGILLALLGYMLYRRWRAGRETAPVLTPLSARERAIAALDALRGAGHLDNGDYRTFYTEATEILRSYIQHVSPGLTTDLTTLELAGRVRAAMPSETATELLELLAGADMVKFARREPPRAGALRELDRMRAWIEAYPPASAPVREEGAAA